MRIGIVGTGIAGLTAAWYLNRAGHHVAVFDQQATFGMEAHCVEFELAVPATTDPAVPTRRRFYSDVPPRMFNSAQWPNLWRLYQELGVETESVNPTKTFATTDQPAVLKLGSNYQPKLSADLLLNPSSRAILKDIGRMISAAPWFVERHATLAVETSKPNEISVPNGWGSEPTMRQYLDAHGYSKPFIYQFLYPALSSTVCTCSFESLDRYPAVTLLEAMLRLIEPEGLFRTTHGTRDVVSRLSSGFNEAFLETAICKISQTNSGCSIANHRGDVFLFDHVIVATQANAAIGLIDQISDKEKQALQSFRYEQVETIVHTDEALMPPRQKDWSTFNVISNQDHRSAMCTIHLNRFYPEWNCDAPVFQTIMPLKAPRAETIITQATMQRPVVDLGSARGHELLAEIHSETDRRIWFCGSYASPGIPLLESGVSSAIGVADRLLAPTLI